jgi:predicted ester cyclase
MGWLQAFPGAHMSVRNSVASGRWAVQEFTFEGTHDEPLVRPAGEIPATPRQLDGRGVQVMRADGDKIAEVHLHFDQVEVRTQLGVMPAAATV